MALFFRTIRDRRVLLLIYTLLGIGVLVMYIGLFPSFKTQQASLEQMVKNFPDSFMKAFNFDIKSFTTIGGFLATEQFSFMWPIISILMLVGYSGYAIAGEIEKGTIELLFSQPISRANLYINRYFAGLIMFAIFVIFSVLSAIPLCKLFNVSFQSESFLVMSLLAFLFGWAIYSIGYMFSAIFSDKGKVFFLTGGILLIMYIINIVSAIRESLTDLKYLSFFHYFNPAKALINNSIDSWAYIVFIGVSVICFIIGLIWFSKRDIAA